MAGGFNRRRFHAEGRIIGSVRFLWKKLKAFGSMQLDPRASRGYLPAVAG